MHYIMYEILHNPATSYWHKFLNYHCEASRALQSKSLNFKGEYEFEAESDDTFMLVIILSVFGFSPVVYHE